jgi:hypothetical protein
MYAVFDDTLPTPPAIAATESTTRMRLVPIGSPFASSSLASEPTATIVPIVSKKSASTSENTSSATVRKPSSRTPPVSEKCPRIEKSGVSTSFDGHVGTSSDQPRGLVLDCAPIENAACRSPATTVIATIEIRMAPRTLRTTSTRVSRTPITNTSSGQPARLPSIPSWSGVPAPGRTKPESTNPTSAMNMPMPTLIAIFSSRGTARNTACRNPVSTRISMTMPSSTTSPIASAHVIPGSAAIENATTALRPRPVAIDSGKFATAPMTIDMTPATRAVVAAIVARPSAPPSR